MLNKKKSCKKYPEFEVNNNMFKLMPKKKVKLRKNISGSRPSLLEEYNQRLEQLKQKQIENQNKAN